MTDTNKITGNENVHPCNEHSDNHGGVHGNGITLRQHYAGRAMQGMLSYNHRPDANGWEKIVNDAVAAADALIVALNQTPSPETK